VRAYGIEEVYLHAFLISQVDGGVDNFTRLPLYLQRTGCVGPGVGLNGYEKRRDYIEKSVELSRGGGGGF